LRIDELGAGRIITLDGDAEELFVHFLEVKADGFTSSQSKGRLWSEASPFSQVWVGPAS
jgi:cold shock CspA family protein